MPCLNVAGIMIERGVYLGEVNNVVFVCGWDHHWVSTYQRLKMLCL